jgi:hypothetical protein
MTRTYSIIISLITSIAALTTAPTARANASVTYEVTSDFIAAANIEYSDAAGRDTLNNVALPWRTNVTVVDPRSTDVEVRADWQPVANKYGIVSPAGRYKWVTVRIYTHGDLLCESILDTGDAVCNGSGPYTGSGAIPLPPFP